MTIAFADALPPPFVDPDITAKGEKRASVRLTGLETLWFNTGTLCNITCANCYIESSPKNDRLVYLTVEDIRPLLDEIATHSWPTRDIAFTGGEPFMNPQMLAMTELCLERGFAVLILTNAMQPMQRPRIKEGLLALKERYGSKLTLRISIDHYDAATHDEERGKGSFAHTRTGIAWLAENGFPLTVAGRTRWHEEEAKLREGFARLFAEIGLKLDAQNPHQLILFPEMEEKASVPEITTACWDILNVRPDQMMCANSRMIVKHKGAAAVSVMPCTLLPYDRAFDMGASLSAAATADGGNFDQGAVKLNHPHCARFCVLGGGSCQG